LRRALAIALFFTCVCCREDRVGSDLAQQASGCAQASEIQFDLRAVAGDYSKDEGKRRGAETTADFAKSCAAESSTKDCCAAALRLKDRLAGQKVANCNDLFQRLASVGCTVSP